MSTTPTANITSKTSPDPRTHSRRLEHDSPPRPQSTPSPPSPAHLTARLTSLHNLAQGPSHHPRSEQDVSTSRPTKRQRTSQSADMAAGRASPSSDSSQSGMADNETEAERSQHSERSAPQASVPPKKKRTRTLTTPHQSAVLHALLAKSRFPTTAMREEVGRQIGLSARKVQIWFQNQRQKARRPQGESAPLTRPPQFGPFPIMAPAGPSSTYPSPSAGGPASEVSLSAPSSARSAAHESKGSLDSDPALSGPGISGWSSSSHRHGSPSRAEWEPSRRPPTSPETPLAGSHHPLPRRLSEARESRGSTRGPAPPPAQATHVGTSPHFSGLLPPIDVSALEARSRTESYVSAPSPFSLHPPSRTFLNIVQRYDSSARSAIEPGSPVRLGIPPPFALQPQPQWDPLTFAPYTRPEFASWSQTSGSSLSPARTSSSATGAHDRVVRNVSPDSSRRHLYPSPGDPLSHHIIPPSRGQRLSMSASSSRASVSGQGQARPDDAGRE